MKQMYGNLHWPPPFKPGASSEVHQVTPPGNKMNRAPGVISRKTPVVLAPPIYRQQTAATAQAKMRGAPPVYRPAKPAAPPVKRQVLTSALQPKAKLNGAAANSLRVGLHSKPGSMLALSKQAALQTREPRATPFAPKGSLSGQEPRPNSMLPGNQLQLKRPIGSQARAGFFSTTVQRSHGKTLYANCKGNYTDGTGQQVAFDVRELELIGNVTGHGGKTDYEAMIKRALKKDKTIPKEIADANITIEEYSTYTRK